MAPRHILVFGSTSPAGTSFCLSALSASHILTLYVRTPSKLPSSISSHPNVTIISGTLDNAAALDSALSCGAKTCISFLGPILNTSYSTPLVLLKIGNGNGTELPVTAGYACIISGLQKYGYERVMVTSTASYPAPQDAFSLVFSLMVWGVYLFFKGAYDEIHGFTPLVTGLDAERVKWTVFRVPMLRNGNGSGKKEKGVKAGYVGSKGMGVVLDREALGEWVLAEMEEMRWVGKCPALSNA